MANGPIKISTGTFDPDALTDQNSLIRNLLQYPEVASVVYESQPMYSLNYVTSAFIEEPETLISDNKYRYSVLGRIERSMTCTGTAPTGTISASQVGYIEFEEDYARPNSTWKFGTGGGGGGTLIIILGRPTRTVLGFKYPCRLMTGDKTAVFNNALVAVGKKAGPVASAFPEHSEKGYGNQQFPDWLENFTTTVRDEHKVTGDAATSVTWLEKNDQALWILGSPEQALHAFGNGGFPYKLEKASWFGQRTVDDNGNVIVADLDGNLITAGSGFLQQIPSSMSNDYSEATITEDTFLDLIATFKHNAGLQKCKIDVHTGIGGAKVFAKVMKDYAAKEARGIIYAMEPKGGGVIVGQDFETYHALGCDITVRENPVLSDDVANTDLSAGTPFPDLSYNFYMVENSMEDGIPTVQKFVKGGNGLSRGMVIKAIPGMVDPMNPKSMTAATARDGYAYEFLSQFMICVRKPNRVGQLIRTS